MSQRPYAWWKPIKHAFNPGPTDDALDDAADEVMGALYALPWLSAPTAERDVMADNEGPRWHGWKFECSAYAQIKMED